MEMGMDKKECNWKLEDCQYCEFGDTLTKEEQINCPHKKQNNVPLRYQIHILAKANYDGYKFETSVLKLIEEAVRQVIEDIELGKLKKSVMMISTGEVKSIIKNRFGFEDKTK